MIVFRHDRAKARSAQVKARAQRLQKKARPKKIVRPKFPRAAEMSYAKAVTTITRIALEIVMERVVPAMEDILSASSNLTKADSVARSDDYASIINDLFGEIRIEFERRTKRAVKETAAEAGKRTASFNKNEQQRVFKSLLGVDVIGREPWLNDFVELFTRGNVGLIKSIPDRFFGEVEDLVRNAAITGRRPEAFADDIQARFGVSESRARLLARDQVGKFNGELTRVRQGKLGIKDFIWRCSMDERVRGNPGGKYPNALPSHWDREGKTFAWDSGAGGEIPGQPIQCRCTAEPVIDLDDLAPEETPR